MMPDKVGEKMSESSDQPSQGAAGQDDSGRNAAKIPGKMSESSDKPSPGFKDPLPPGTDSKSGPGSDGPV